MDWEVELHDDVARWFEGLCSASTMTSEVRILFAFDPARRAILLVAGDKSGRWQEWYRTTIPIADQRYAEHLAATTVKEG